MKILSASVRNFGSYKELNFNFYSKGLTLISGPTGSGKSTLCDIVPWALFGVSSKGGAVDEVISWNSSGLTKVELTVLIKRRTYIIVRTRNTNDLFAIDIEDPSVPLIRGKDLADTQKLINDLLEMDADTYLASSYYHEFSTTAQFFSTTAKNRRTITEQLADLTLAVSIQDSASSFIKDLRKERQELLQNLALKKHSLTHLQTSLQQEESKSEVWESTRLNKLSQLSGKSRTFESDKYKTIQRLKENSKELEADRDSNVASVMSEIESCKSQLKLESDLNARQAILDERSSSLPTAVCSECGSTKDSHLKLILAKDQYSLDTEKRIQEGLKREIITLESKLNNLKKQVNPYTERLIAEGAKVNTYEDQIYSLEAELNPYKETTELQETIKQALHDLDTIQSDINEVNITIVDTELLTDVVNAFRGTLIQRTIDRLQFTTNELLSKHFDAEIRVIFSVEAADKIEVEITKDGNKCTFHQLSKGQRQILKLAFSVSVMRAVANHAGISSNCLFMDESLDGLSEEMKAKAYTLLEELALEYDSVFVVEHSENFKSLFNNKINVSLVNGESVIYEEK